MTNTSAIAYYRVSTAQQGQSGLGLAGQRVAVERHAKANGLTITQEFIEVETGTNKRRRAEIQKAIAKSKTEGAVLLIAKLDRLARNVHFISGLMESGVKFVAVDMPTVTNLTLHILAAVAEEEAKMISKRTKAALDAKRERDGEWRVSQLDNAAREKALKVRREASAERLAQARYVAGLLRQSGKSYGKTAKELNEQGYTTSRGKQFTPTAVKRMLEAVAA